MSNQLTPAHLVSVAQNGTASLLGSKPTNILNLIPKAGYANFNFQSEMSLAAMSESTKLLTKQVASLLNPLSPASLYPASIEMDIEERLFDATSSVKMLTAQVAMHMDKEWRNKLFRQIDSLHDLDEWDSDDKPVKRSSFKTFLKAILQIKPLQHPGLGLTYDGYLIAAWTTGRDQLTTEFLPNDRVRWVLTRHIDEETEQAAGQTTVSRLYECLKPYHPDHWFLHEEK